MKVHDCSIELRKADLAATPARIAALQFFESQEKPIDSFSLVETLANQGVDRVTAFRIVNTFVEKGLLRKVQFLEDKTRYELANRGDHHHFICRSCGVIQDIEDTVVPNFVNKLQSKYGFVVTNHSLEFFGTCKKCMEEQN